MSYLADDFKKYFLGQGHKETSCNSYNVNLKKIDTALREIERIGLDETISKDLSWLQKWAKTTSGAPFDKETSNRRSAPKKISDVQRISG